MIHFSIYCGTAILLGVLAQTGWSIAQSITVSILAVLVALIGLPHGGLDFQKGRAIVGSRLPRPNSSIAATLFVGIYLAIAAIGTLGWFIAPITTVLLFFALSAWHFGLEEEEDFSGSNPAGELNLAARLGLAARGGMVIWIPCVFVSQSVIDTLGIVLPGQSDAAGIVVFFISNLWPAFTFALIFDVVRQTRVLPKKEFIVSIIKLACSAFLFVTCPVLVSFIVYFCGWHSIRGLIHMRREFQGDTRKFFMAIVPITLVTIVLFAAGAFCYMTTEAVPSALVRTIFIGLSSIAVPHLLLHMLANALDRDSGGGLSLSGRHREPC